MVELGHSVAAPFGGQVLAELGARVVKVERPSVGDDARAWGPPFWGSVSTTFLSFNRDKQSIAVDLKDDEARARLRSFILEQADIVLQNMRPGLVAKYGLDQSLREDKPGLIYCNLSAYGAVGPLKSHPGYDPLMQAFGGIMSITGEEGREPVRVGTSIVDMAAGMWAVVGILAALRRRSETGQGSTVDTSLFETALSWMTASCTHYLACGEIPRRLGSEAVMLAPYKAYSARDGYLVVAAGNDNHFRRLCEVLGHPEWPDDARFASVSQRVRNRVALNSAVEAVIAGRDRAYWIGELEAAQVPVAPLQNVAEVLGHAQTKALGMMQAAPDSEISLMGLPLSFDGARPPFLQAPPALGADTERAFGSDVPPARGRETGKDGT